jgi:two-component system response regulator GlrR
MRRSIFSNRGIRHLTQTFASRTESGDETWHLQPAGARTDVTTSPMLIGESPQIGAVVRQIEKMARSHAVILIQGETGSGKELAARAIHCASSRAAGPFVAINCGAVPDGLIETELFGHGKGAFTDAREARPGVIAQARSGTLFLDETDALSAKAQVTLLRFLQDLRYRPIGTAQEIAADVRVIAASNQNLQTLVADGRFRPDLLYRLNIFELWIPPLRRRPEDIELLAKHFIDTFSGKYGIHAKRLHPATLDWLRQHDWPGNVRELENWVHRELLLAEGDEIRGDAETNQAAVNAEAPPSPDLRTAKARAIAEFESSYVSGVLARAHGNVTAAARMAGKERRAFGKLLKKYGIDKSRYQS